MGSETKIEWTHATANLWWGCVEVSGHEGCTHCYAREFDRRYQGNHWGARRPRRRINATMSNLVKWNAQAQKQGQRFRVFVGSMMDIFEKTMPLVDNRGVELPLTTGELRANFFDSIGTFEHLTFQLLTKRPWNIRKYIPASWWDHPPQNVWFGTSVSDQATADKYGHGLLENTPPDSIKFLSVEPLLAPVTLVGFLDQIDWVIVGGESGVQARPLNPIWVYALVAQCLNRNTAVFVKQLGSVWAKQNQSFDSKGGDMADWPVDIRIRQFPDERSIYGDRHIRVR